MISTSFARMAQIIQKAQTRHFREQAYDSPYYQME